MANYKISNAAKEDLIRIHQYGIQQFGMKQADKYFESFFDHFKSISKNPYAYQSVGNIRSGYYRCVNGSDSIYFRINKNTVEIMAIIGRQDINNIFNPGNQSNNS